MHTSVLRRIYRSHLWVGEKSQNTESIPVVSELPQSFWDRCSKLFQSTILDEAIYE